MESIYDHKKQAERIERNISKSKEISTVNKKLMFCFKDDCLAHTIGLPRIVKCLTVLRKVALWLKKDFDVCTVDDVKKLVALLEIKEEYCARTKVDYRGVIKKFFNWLSKQGTVIDVSWIKTTFKKSNETLPSELLTEKELLAMINACKSARDRAIIMSLYESGCRIGEFLKLRLKDVLFERPGCIFIVNGKTGGRRIRVISAEPYLLDWINMHPHKDNPEAFLWIGALSPKMLQYPAFCKLLRVAAKRAGIKKKVNPHSFRHARATYLASRFTEQQLKVFFGWTRGSDMASVYVHLSGRDVDDALLDAYGIKQEGEGQKITKLKPLLCPRCNTQNEASNRFCKLCGTILDESLKYELLLKETQHEEVNKVMNLLFKDKDILALVAEKIKELKV